MRPSLSCTVILLVGLVLAGVGVGSARAADCPLSPTSSAASVASPDLRLEGRLVYHDSIRHWFELKLRRPVCGEVSVQLVPLDERYKELEVLRGCDVRSIGPVDYSPTGYYSLNLYQGPKSIKRIGKCALKPPLPHPSWPKPDRRVRAYRVEMHVDYRPGDHPVRFRVLATRRELRPWQAYASYELTGGFVLYGSCGDGFFVDRVFGPREARPSHFLEREEPGDMAAWDPESAAEAGNRDLRLGYTCIRHPARG